MNIETTALNIKKKIIKKDETLDDFENKPAGVISVKNKLKMIMNTIKFIKFLKGHIKSFLNGLKSFPHLWIK